MAGDLAISGLDWPFGQGNTAFDEACGTSALLAAIAALALAAGQIAAPSELRGPPDLGVDEAVDALVGDHLAAILPGEPACDLFGRPPRRSNTARRRPGSRSRREPVQRRARA